MGQIRYICAGSCGSMIPVEKYKQGQKNCVDKSCDRYRNALERGEYCANCNTTFEEGEDHICF